MSLSNDTLTTRKLANLLRKHNHRAAKAIPANQVRGWRPLASGFQVQATTGGNILLGHHVGGTTTEEGREKGTEEALAKYAEILDAAGIEYTRRDDVIIVTGGKEHHEDIARDLENLERKVQFETEDYNRLEARYRAATDPYVQRSVYRDMGRAKVRRLNAANKLDDLRSVQP